MTASNRIDMVDALRGYALFGLFMVHCVERFELYWLDPRPDAWFDTTMALFAGKSFAIFALLFGFSFATIMANERSRGADFTWRFAWRLVLLFAFGTVHAAVYRGDILQVLALAGLLLIPFDRIRSDRLLLLLLLAALAFAQAPLWLRWWAAGEGAGWAVAQPLYFSWGNLQTLAEGSPAAVALDNLGPGTVGKWSFYLETGRMMEIAGLFLVGIVVHRRRLFADAARHTRVWLAVAAISALLWCLTLALPAAFGSEAQRQSAEWLLGQARNLPAMAFQVAMFVLLWLGPVRKLLALLAPAGRMTLTLYVGQSLVGAPLFYGYGLDLWDKLSNAEVVLWGFAAFAAQLALAAWWFRHYRYGPLEWLWRAGTRTTLAVPFRQAG